MHHFELLNGKNVGLLPPLENFQIRQTMHDMLIVTFSNMVPNNQAIVNPTFINILHNQIEIIDIERQ